MKITTKTKPAPAPRAKVAAAPERIPVPQGYDAAYVVLLRSVETFAIYNGPVFTTDADNLWWTFLENLPVEIRAHHQCSACRHFVEKFGGLVTLPLGGRIEPVAAMWGSHSGSTHSVQEPYAKAVKALQKLVEKARITGVFLSSDVTWGQPVTGPWRHMSTANPRVFAKSKLKTAGQAMAEKLEEYGMLMRSLVEYDAATCASALKLLCASALKLLSDGQLFRSEKCLGVAKWLLDLHEARAAVGSARQKEAVTWRAVAEAPAGFTHVKSGMIGTLLDDIKASEPFAVIKKKFEEKMDPMFYRRATVAPSSRQIDVAERAVQELGIAPAFARRYAKDLDFQAPDATAWRPSLVPPLQGMKAKPTGVFDDLRPAGVAPTVLDVPAKAITWEKFSREVLPGAALLEYRVPTVGRFCALTAALDPLAPPILQWDSAELRNDVSWSFPNPPARGDEWGLTPGTLVPVRMIVNSPNLWRGETRFRQQGRGIFLLLEGAKDVRGLPGGGLFTEHLRGELSPYRSTIDSHLNRLVVQGADDPGTIGFGIGLFAGGDWTETAAPQVQKLTPGAAPARVHVILVVDDSGSMSSYIYAARTALSSLLAAVRAMPGQVDVTVVLFGNHARVLYDRMPLSALEGVTNQMTGGSGGTALNDTLIDAIQRAQAWGDRDASVFLGIVTDGAENQSRRGMSTVAGLVREVNATGRWTIAYAGAGNNPRAYAQEIGLAPGNVTTFQASAEGFHDIGVRYASSAMSLATDYSSGKRATTSFFGAASGREAIGTDHPVLVVTSKSGTQSSFKLDRWD